MKESGVYIEYGISDYQIFQQDENGFAKIEIGGRCEPENNQNDVYVRAVLQDYNEVVVPYFKAEMLEGKKWRAAFELPAGGLYRVETILQSWSFRYGLRGDMALNIGVGDVYVLAGQSNNSGHGHAPMYDPPRLGVHLFRNRNKWDIAAHPFNETTDTAHSVNREQTNNLNHSPWLAFGRLLMDRLNYPIGLLQTSLSGVNIDKWDPDDSDNLFTLMVETARLASNGKVKGVVWFQGCSDAVADRCDQYLGRFKKLKEAYDEALGLKIPWITFQINRCAGAACPVGWPAIREAQRQAARTMPGVYVIPTNDSNLSDTIHNDTAGNLMIGERAARLALSKIYGRDNFYMAPDVASVSYENGLVRLKLENVRGVLFHQDDVSGFTVADEEGDAGVEKFWVENTSDIIIKTKREIAGGFTVRGTQDPHGEKYPIYDNFTRLPMLSFSVSCDV